MLPNQSRLGRQKTPQHRRRSLLSRQIYAFSLSRLNTATRPLCRALYKGGHISRSQWTAAIGIRRRQFISCFGGVAAAWLVAPVGRVISSHSGGHSALLDLHQTHRNRPCLTRRAVKGKLAIFVDALHLREKAYYCVALSRQCSDSITAQILEGLGIELMEKVAELEKYRTLTPPGSDSPKSTKCSEG